MSMRRREARRRAYDKLGQVCKGGNPRPGEGKALPEPGQEPSMIGNQVGPVGKGPGPHPTRARGSRGGGFTAEPRHRGVRGQERLCGPLLRNGRGQQRRERGPHGKVLVLLARESRTRGHSSRRCWNTGQ